MLDALASQLFHAVWFKLDKTRTQFEKGMVIFSFDIDVGSQKLGILNDGKNDSAVHDYYSERHIGEIEEAVIPVFLDLFETYKIPVTFAVRGQLTSIDNSLLPAILASKIKHDVGGHGYTHHIFSSLSHQQAEEELEMLSSGLRKYGVEPKSFVFPRNQIMHLDLLEKFGYECFRAKGNDKNDKMAFFKYKNLIDIHPSFFLQQKIKPKFLNSYLRIAVKNQFPLHFWSHLWTFGDCESQVKKNIEESLVPFLDFVREENQDKIDFETMLSASRKARHLVSGISKYPLRLI